MADYDFRTLSPHDFELLCRDLLQKSLGVRLESFTTGRDSGIDFRYRARPATISSSSASTTRSQASMAWRVSWRKKERAKARRA